METLTRLMHYTATDLLLRFPFAEETYHPWRVSAFGLLDFLPSASARLFPLLGACPLLGHDSVTSHQLSSLGSKQTHERLPNGNTLSLVYKGQRENLPRDVLTKFPKMPRLSHKCPLTSNNI